MLLSNQTEVKLTAVYDDNHFTRPKQRFETYLEIYTKLISNGLFLRVTQSKKAQNETFRLQSVLDNFTFLRFLNHVFL